MFTKKPSNESVALDQAIMDVFCDLKNVSSEHEDYTTSMKHLSELYKIKEHTAPKTLSPDVMLTAGANIVGILLILHFEQTHVIASKALGFVLKLR
jgi:hypothetical protein